MKNLFTVLVFSFLFSQTQTVQAQRSGQSDGNPPSIRGRVIDAATDLPMEFATVTLYNAADSIMVDGAITEADGNFSINAKPGRYYAYIEYIGYQKMAAGDIVLDPQSELTDIGNLAMSSDASTLAEIEVRAEKSTMQLGLDRKVFNVGKDLANSGLSAADVLDNVPSVTVDVEGNVELRGSGGVRILIDGKPSGLVGVGDANGLRNIPANMIDRVEVITNPGASYEAEGMSGIINIVLKKDRRQGVNGSFDLTLGNPSEYGVAANMNYRRDRLNFFLNYSIRYRKGPGEGNSYQEFYQNDTTFITDNESRRERGGLSNNVRFGADYFFSPNDILTTAFNYNYGNDDNFSRLFYRDYVNSRDNLVSFFERTDTEFEKEPKLEYALTYKKIFEDRKGHELTLDARYQDNVEEEGSDLVETQLDTRTGEPLSNVPVLHQQSNNRERERNMIFQLDYVKPFGEQGKFEAGGRAGIREVSNDFLVEQQEADGAWVPLEGLNNNIVYDENIYAAYSSVGNKHGKFSWQTGLRYEYSDVQTALQQTGEVNPRDYSNLFPSAFLGYELPGQNTVQLSFSRRIRRPQFWELNPFFTFSDRRNFWAGNPDLDPEYTNSFEIGHLKYFEKGSITSSVYYRRTNGVIERLRLQLTDTSSVTRPYNLAVQDDWGVEFTFNYEPTKTWRLNGNANIFRSETSGEFEGQDLSAEALTMTGRLSSRITFFKKVDFQVNFNYRAPRNTTQGRSLAIWHVDPAASMDFLGGNGTLTLSVRDLFNTRRRRYVTEGENFFVEGDWQWRARQVTLTASYRLNQNKQRERGGRGGDMEGGGEF